MEYFIKRVICYFISLFPPSICASCRQFLSEQQVFCSLCAEKITPVVSVMVPVTASLSVKLFSISAYKNPLRKLILAKGRSDATASYQMGELLWNRTPLQHVEYDVVVPIPLHWTRYARRGFNQAEIIAGVVAKKKGVPLVNLLKRVKRTQFQSELVPLMRMRNVQDAFVVTAAHKELYKDKHILLIDDLMTTGSTLKAAAKELMILKPKKITAAVICRVT